MDRGHEFTVDLPGEGTYIVKLLEGVRIEKSDGTAVGRWPAFDLEATGDSEDEVCEKLVGKNVWRVRGESRRSQTAAELRFHRNTPDFRVRDQPPLGHVAADGVGEGSGETRPDGTVRIS